MFEATFLGLTPPPYLTGLEMSANADVILPSPVTLPICRVAYSNVIVEGGQSPKPSGRMYIRPMCADIQVPLLEFES